MYSSVVMIYNSVLSSIDMESKICARSSSFSLRSVLIIMVCIALDAAATTASISEVRYSDRLEIHSGIN